MKKVIYTKNAPTPIGPYSQAILADNTLYCSGQLAISVETGDLINGDIAFQTRKAIENIIAVLNASEFDINDVVKTTCFLSDINNFSGFNSVYEEYFISKPARSCVAVKTLPKNALVEIEVIASK